MLVREASVAAGGVQQRPNIKAFGRSKNSSPTLPLGFSPGRWNAAPPLPPTSLSIPLYEP